LNLVHFSTSVLIGVHQWLICFTQRTCKQVNLLEKKAFLSKGYFDLANKAKGYSAKEGKPLIAMDEHRTTLIRLKESHSRPGARSERPFSQW